MGISKIGIMDLLIQMFDAIEALHTVGKSIHRNLSPDKFRVKDGKIKLINISMTTQYLDL